MNLMKYICIPVMAFIALSCWLNVALAADTEDETIWMPDPNLRAKVRETLNLAKGTPLTQEAMQGLSELIASRSYWNREEGTQIVYLTGLEHATNLRDWNLIEIKLLISVRWQT